MAIQVKALKEIPGSTRKLYERAIQSRAQKNYAYAIQMLHMVLHAEPGFIEGHRALRQVQLEKVGNKPSAMRSLVASLTTVVPVQMKGPVLLKQGKAQEALELAEKALDADPTSVGILQFLAAAAGACGLYDIAIESLDAAAHFNPKNIKILSSLAKAYAEAEDYQKAITVWQQVVQMNPNNTEVATELKRLTALAAMKQANWENADSYRDVIKNKEEAQLLEQQTRVGAKDENTLKNLVRNAEAEVAKAETNANLLRLAELYRKDQQLDKALATYQRSIEISGTLDPAIEDTMTEIQSQQFENRIQEWKDYAAAHPDKTAEADANIQTLLSQKDDMLLKRLLNRVERYPNDANYRYELGEMYWKRNDLDTAMKEFQFSQRSPQYRLKALTYMGRCMAKKGMLDLAVEQFNLALEGLDKSDLDRKDVLYNLGTVYEQLQQEDKARETFRELFSLDVNYLDVSAKMQQYYQKKG